MHTQRIPMMRKWNKNASASNKNKAQAVKRGSWEPLEIRSKWMDKDVREKSVKLHNFFFNHSKLALNRQWSVQLCSDRIFRKRWTRSTITCLCASQHDTISCKSLVSFGSGSLPRACLLQNMFSPRHLQDLTRSMIRAGLCHHIQSASPLISCLPQKKKKGLAELLESTPASLYTV